MKTLMNIRVPENLKIKFQDSCKRSHTYMTTEMIRFMKSFIEESNEFDRINGLPNESNGWRSKEVYERHMSGS